MRTASSEVANPRSDMKGPQMRFVLAIAVVVAFVGAIGSAEQAWPDFSGRWVRVAIESPDSAPSDPAIGRNGMVGTSAPPAIFGSEFLARQDAKSLTIERTINKKPFVASFNLDGSDAVDQEGPLHTVSIATWRGSSLVIVTRYFGLDAGTDNEITRTLSLQNDGTLHVERTTGTGQPQTTDYRRGDK